MSTDGEQECHSNGRVSGETLLALNSVTDPIGLCAGMMVAGFFLLRGLAYVALRGLHKPPTG
jgi:hypothetical protein